MPSFSNKDGVEIINKILSNFQKTAGLFSHPFYTKAFAIILLALSCLGTKGVKNEKIYLEKDQSIFSNWDSIFLL